MSHLLAAIGALILLAGGFLLYARGEVVDPESLGDRSAAVLVDDVELRLALSAPIAEAIGAISPAGRPTDAQVAVALEDPRVAAAFARVTAATAEEIFESGAGGTDLNLDMVALAAFDAAGLETEGRGFVGVSLPARVDLAEARVALDALAFAEEASDLAVPVLAIAAVLLLASMALAPGIATGLSRVGVAIAVAAAIGAATLLAGRTVLSGSVDGELTGGAVEAAWDGLLGDLLIWTAIAGVVAIIVAAIASLVRRT